MNNDNNGLNNLNQQPMNNNGLNNLNQQPMNNNGLNNLNEQPMNNNGLNNLNQQPMNNNGLNNLNEQPMNNNGLNNLNQQPMNNNGLNNLNQQPMNNNGLNNLNQQNINNNSSFNMNKNGKNTSKLVLVIVIVIIVISAIVFVFNMGSSKKSYITSVGSTLEIEEKYEMLNIKALSSIEKKIIADNIFWNGDFLALKVMVENPTTADLSFSFIDFYLTDADKNELYITNNLNTYRDSILGRNISSGDSDEGYIYFYSDENDDDMTYITDYSKIDDIKYLKVSVISDRKMNSGSMNYNKQDYYLELN